VLKKRYNEKEIKKEYKSSVHSELALYKSRNNPYEVMDFEV